MACHLETWPVLFFSALHMLLFPDNTAQVAAPSPGLCPSWSSQAHIHTFCMNWVIWILGFFWVFLNTAFFFFKETIFFLPLHSFQVTCFSKLVDIILLHFFHTYIHSTYTNTQVRGTGAFALQKCDMPTSLQLSFNIMMWKFLQVN